MEETQRIIIMALAERLYICSRLLTAAAEKLGWDQAAVQSLLDKLKRELEEASIYACLN